MCCSFEDLLSLGPYSLAHNEKQSILFNQLRLLTEHHYAQCEPYRRMLDAQSFIPATMDDVAKLPFLPVSLFKLLNLKSISDSEVVKTMTSSGTTGQHVSRIYLDKMTASRQQKILVKIVSQFTGAGRLPLLIIDSPEVLKNRFQFSARGAGILGFSLFGSDRAWALDEKMSLNFNLVQAFLQKHQGKRILLFGFTFMVWQHFYKALINSNCKLDLSNALLIHGGGWKKLQNEAVSPEEFIEKLYYTCSLSSVHDYYGMVEQTGCIYMQCEHGHLHTSIFSDIIIRDPQDFSISAVGQPGIIQVLSILPNSYPGHSLLTEDEGVLLGEDDCLCGRKGKYFRIMGRLKQAELRGCSDIYAAQF
ncbi:acyl-protein synthetase [Citrobacter werkmanii]|uniref:LuxE/PaaK family acyltransferase n=1 Tax=Citrobacter TaxID=544 RepID=UPI000A10A22F|nr:acyl-protein synthetase [Citrobacter werkmanii]MBS6075658.1 acyl-protein synthetase [Citrobacter freundii]NBD84063.1 acyl-protein synthetase [Citrobacter werkmanii]ORT77688.1 acyl-protein synthetase [Citrobacter werkmanii]OSP17703.1 acyl-protein synthetase [Citrobacter werkmanii]